MSDVRPTPDGPALKEVFKGDFSIGVALSQGQLEGEDSDAIALAEKHFNSITAENLLKWEAVHPQPDRYEFGPVDLFVAFGEARGMQIIGHTLVWFDQTPASVFRDNAGNPLGRDALLGRMREHIFTVAGRYKGRIHGWDVVNEALVDGQYRDCEWLRIIGEDYVLKAFEFAREADPDAELYYNDFNLWKPQQLEGVVRLVRSLQSRGVRVGGIGEQGHWGMDYPSLAEIENIINAVAGLGIPLMITELDVSVLPYSVEHEKQKLSSLPPDVQQKLNPYAGGLPEAMERAFAERYAALFGLFRARRDKLGRITFWAVHDAQSWRNYVPVEGRTDYPMLFDRRCRPKPAFDAVIKTWQGVTMKNERDLEIVAAGHTCLDLIPAFTIQHKVDKMTDVLVPGKMINMGDCVVVGGGPVTNAGVSIRRLGVKTELIGKIGNDDFGKQILRWYEEHEGHFKGIKMVEGESTSYTIAICIPGIDRFYLHHCGANDTFGYDDMDFDIVGRSELMLFGYPPWMRKLYENTGAELTRILKKTMELGTTTALDLSLPDASYADKFDWKAILQDWVPLSDIMVPSAEELFYFLHKEQFNAKKARLGPKEGVLDHMTVNEIADMGGELLEMGTAIAMVKCGHRGLYVRTGAKERLEKLGAAKCADLDNWANRELWFPVYEEERFVGALGSGDSAIAGFLSAFVFGHTIESCLRYANAAGSMNVTVPDGLTWNKGFDDLTRRICAGWKTKSLAIDEPGWKFEKNFWVGPNNRGKWEN